MHTISAKDTKIGYLYRLQVDSLHQRLCQRDEDGPKGQIRIQFVDPPYEFVEIQPERPLIRPAIEDVYGRRGSLRQLAELLADPQVTEYRDGKLGVDPIPGEKFFKPTPAALRPLGAPAPGTAKPGSHEPAHSFFDGPLGKTEIIDQFVDEEAMDRLTSYEGQTAREAAALAERARRSFGMKEGE